MIDRICENLERKAKENNHKIVDGFYEALIMGKAKMLRMDCEVCDFFAIVDPNTGKNIQSYSGPCRGKS
jgi:hypothetical protein